MVRQKSLKVELLRIFSIWLVITNHIILKYPNGAYIYIFLDVLSSMGAPIFFVITGFYIYKNNDLLKVYKNYIFKVFIPFAILSITVIMFEKTINFEMTFIDNLYNINIYNSLKIFIKAMLSVNSINLPKLLGHTWYIFTYSIIIIFFPLTNFIIKSVDKRILYILCILFLFYLLYIDINININFTVYTSSLYFPKIIFITVISHLVYNDLLPLIQDRTINNKEKSILLFIVSVVVFILLFIKMLINQYKMCLLNNNSMYYYIRYESFIMLVVCLSFVISYFLFFNILNYDNNIKLFIGNYKSKIYDFILFFSSKTYYVYLLHPYLIVFFQKNNLLKWFYSYSNNFIVLCIFCFICVIIIYVLTIIIVYLYKKVLSKILCILKII